MDLKKVFDQTVRELKREVNKKVLKVPEMEQKVLDATSNEPWGPHGTSMADIAQATRNYNEYQMIMSILWKRINDSGKNWRHVYKALAVLEYLVAHGAERVIDELKEHSYQISTLSDFQYVEASGKDQGINVRRKAQAIVTLVNDKERIREVRQKAVANRDKYRGVSSTGGIYKASSYSSTGGSYGDRHDDDRYGSTGRYGGRDDDKYGYGKEKDFDRYRDEYGKDGDDKYGRDGDRYGKDGDRYGKEDRYRDDYSGEYDQEEDRYSSKRGDRQYDKYSGGERDRDRPYDDDGRYSSRGGGSKADDYSQDDRRVDRKNSGSRMPAPPNYEEALGGNDSGYCGIEEPRDGSGLVQGVAQVPRHLSAQATTLPSTANASVPDKPFGLSSQDDFDDFDPRGASVVAPVAVSAHASFFGQTFEAEASSNIRALLPPSNSSLPSTCSDAFGDSDIVSGFTAAPVSVSSTLNQPHLDGDLFGEPAFKAELPPPSNLFASTPESVSAPTTVTANTVPPVMTNSGPNGFNAFSSISVKSSSLAFDAIDFLGEGSFTPLGTLPTGMGAVNPTTSIPHLDQQLPSTEVHLSQADSRNLFAKPQQKDKFQPKSTVWADSLSKGLIDLNISGPKNNPLAELGIDLDSGSLRMERKKEDKASTASRGKAMGSGSGLGIAGAGVLGAASTMGGMGMTPGMGIGMAPMGRGMGMGMGMGPGMGMGLAMGTSGGLAVGTNPGLGMGPPMGIGQGSELGGPSPMLGMGGYPNQHYSGFR